MKKILVIGIIAGLGWQSVYAGNPDRKGEAGAPELNMNAYARSAGFWDLNVASVKGLEAERLNPAGLGLMQGTEIIGSYTSWLTGAGVNGVQGGFATRVKSNAFALSINSLNFGAIDKTTTANPEGGLGIFKPTYLNIGISYAKNFSLGSTAKMGGNLITGGVSLRLVSEIVGNVTATGFAFDAGLLYTTGKKENLHFGVALRNVGTPMKFGGDALSFEGTAAASTYAVSYSKKTNKFELPTQLNMGVAYDLWLGPTVELEGASAGKYIQHYRLTFMGQYSANAFGLDNYGLGVEFSLREIFMLRLAYRFENGMFKDATTGTAYTGLAAGLSVNVPLKKGSNTPAIGLDYGFRMTSPNTDFKHTHSVGLRVTIGGAKEKAIPTVDPTPTAATSESGKPETRKKGKKSKATVEEVEEKDAAIDSLIKANQALKVKAETPIVKIDTVIKTQIQIVTKTDTVLVPTMLEKSDYKGGNIDTLTQGGKKVLQFNDYEALEYETGSAKINAKSYAYLNYLVNILKKNPAYKVSFDGHTDNVGDEAANTKLSQDRVDAVKAYFVSKGISENRIATQAYGSKKPKYKNDNSAGRAKNRRVEIYMEM